VRAGIKPFMRFMFVGVLLASIPAIGIALDNTADYESGVIRAINLVRSNNMDSAFVEAEALVKNFPKGRLGQLVYADMLMAYAGQPVALGQSLGQSQKDNQQLDDLRSEARLRWLHHREDSPAHMGLLPSSIVQIAPNQPYVLFIDLKHSRLYVYKNNGESLVLVDDYFVTMGLQGSGKEKEGDQRTPLGVYHVTKFIPDSQLPDLYGRGAFPINYPNQWDKRLGRTGYGIWLHGTPSNTYNRAPQASDGCVVLSNLDFLLLDKYVSPKGKMPVVISADPVWINKAAWLQQKNSSLRILSQWQKDWESLDAKKYLQHYSQSDFKAGKHNYKTWSEHKIRVNGSKAFIRVGLDQLNVFAYPGEDSMLQFDFIQDYQSSNYTGRSAKKMLWKKTNNDWKVIFEG